MNCTCISRVPPPTPSPPVGVWVEVWGWSCALQNTWLRFTFGSVTPPHPNLLPQGGEGTLAARLDIALVANLRLQSAHATRLNGLSACEVMKRSPSLDSDTDT